MKKITLIVMALFVTASAFAQDAQESKNIRWGVKGGINIASEVAGEASTNSRTGIHLGGIMETPISAGVDFQLELLYSMQGATYKIGNTDYTDKFDYLNVPFMFKIYVNKNRRFSIDIGPQLGLMVSAKISSGNKTVDVYDNDKLNKFDAAIGLGISYKIKDNFDFVFRANVSLTPMMDGEEHKNSVGQLGVAYRF